MTDIHTRIRAVREERGLTREAFGTAIGATAAKVQALEGGRQRVDHPTLEALSRNLGIDANWLLLGGDIPQSALSEGKVFHTENLAPDSFAPIPRYSVQASAGGGVAVAEESETGFYAISHAWLKHRNLPPANLAVISVAGDSMEPRLNNGDLILINRKQHQIADGIAYVVRIGDELLVKYIQRATASAISLVSENRRYPPREVDIEALGDQIEIIGRVVASMHEW